MKLISINLCSIVLLFAVISYCESKKITLHAKAEWAQPGNDVYLHFDDEKNTVRDVAESFCINRGLTCNRDDEIQPSVRNILGFHYKLDQTIKKALLMEGQWVIVKFW